MENFLSCILTVLRAKKTVHVCLERTQRVLYYFKRSIDPKNKHIQFNIT